ncbi:MAG: AAA family ATPase [Deltaproteobacteria bacterium]|nr:AAA family ATPase [Deltaproteobacteria bacterium]MBW2661661.1 AAA family ATPase [Deltaproteobacteria bacterium]
MLNVDLNNPFKAMGYDNEDIIPEGGFGAVLARAGVGKTAFLVQLALRAIVRNKNVLHVSLNDPVNKVSLWYKEVFNNLAKQYNIKEPSQLWETMLPHRFIMTFKAEGFSVPTLEERMTDLSEQNIFSPQIVVVDGLLFDEFAQKSLSDLKAIARKLSLQVWFAVRTHRHEESASDGMPASFSNVSDLFDVAIQLQPKGKEINVLSLKGAPSTSDFSELCLDPSTMLIKKQ